MFIERGVFVKIKKMLSVMLMFVLTTVSSMTLAAFAENDKTGPEVSAGNTVRTYIGQTTKFTVSAYDESDLSDNILTPEDFTVAAYGLFAVFPVVEVVNVSQPYISSSNPNFTQWDVTVKGLFPGRASLQVRKNVISDVHGNQNSYSPAKIIENGDFLALLYHLIFI